VFVVDYGTADPMPFGVTETPVDPGGALMADLGVATAVDSGPIAGWYPDPAMQHQARFWDGFKWTDRVADNGVESIDPVPGTASVQSVATATTVSDTADAWSAQVFGDTELATGYTSVATATAEPAMSAGQASMAMLPDHEVDDSNIPTERPERVRPVGKVVVGSWMVIGGAAALVLGSMMPWMHVRGPRVNDATSASGMNIGDGRITVVLAIVLAVLAAGILTGRLQRIGGTKVAAMGVLVAGAAAVAVTAVDIADVADRASRLGVPAGAVTSVGSGLWLCFLGGVLAVAGGLLAFANRDRNTVRI
jgi:hypothetical protein